MFSKISSDLLQLLKNVVQEDIEEFNVELMNNEKGEGFVGEILFVTLTHKITREMKEVVIKQEQLKNGEILSDLSGIFQREVYFYADIWPLLEKYYENVTGKQLSFVPKCLVTSDEGRKRIILENTKAN